MDQLPRLGKRGLISLLLFTCNLERFPLPLVLGMGYVILLWHALSLPYNYFVCHVNFVLAALMLFLVA